MLRVLSGTILLANSKPHSPVLEAEKRNVHFLDNMRDFEPLHPTYFGPLSNRNRVWRLGTKKKKYICLVQIPKKRHPHLHPLTHGKHAGIDLGYLWSCRGRWKHMPHSLHLRSHLPTFLYGWRCWGPERLIYLQEVTQLLSDIIIINKNSTHVYQLGVAGLNQ